MYIGVRVKFTLFLSNFKQHCLSPQWLWLDPGSVHVGFMVDKLTLRQIFLQVWSHTFSTVIIVHPVLCPH